MPSRGVASWSRETRLLLLTIAVSLAALVVLARFRFPVEERSEAPPQPLERLAARATYDELAAIIQRTERRVAPSLLVLRTSSAAAASAEPRTLRSMLDHPEPIGANHSFVVAIRIKPDIAVARLAPGTVVEGILGDFDAVPLLIGHDPLRQLALVRVPPPADGAQWAWTPSESLTVPRYVVAVEAARGGITPRPIFLGRADRIDDLRWNAPLVVLARTPVTVDGALVFSLEGEFIGVSTPTAGVLGIVPGNTLVAAAERMLDGGSPRLTDFGLALKPLNAELMKTLENKTGVLVHDIERGSRAHNELRAGDVIHTIDGRPAMTPESVLLQLAQIAPDATTRFVVRRDDKTLTLDVPPPGPPPAPGGSTTSPPA